MTDLLMDYKGWPGLSKDTEPEQLFNFTISEERGDRRYSLKFRPQAHLFFLLIRADQVLLPEP